MSSKYKYTMVIQWSKEDNAYVAIIPDLPGCTGWGNTYEEATHEVINAMELWIEMATEKGEPLPKPSNVKLSVPA